MHNFLGLSPELSRYENASAVVFPVPFDKTSSYVKGADRGPQALIEASHAVEFYDIETRTEMHRRGIFTAPPFTADSGAELNAGVEERVGRFVDDGKFVVTLGGEHSISLGAVKAHAARHKDMCVLQLDAHTDLREQYQGDPLSHASIMARVREVVPNTVAVGIRSMDISEREKIDPERIFFAEELPPDESWIEAVIAALSPKVYLTFDLDVFDPSIMPSTGTPEPGGLGWYEVLRLLRAVCEHRELVGCDVVELCPGENKAPDFLAAKLVYKLLTYKFELLRP